MYSWRHCGATRTSCAGSLREESNRKAPSVGRSKRKSISSRNNAERSSRSPPRSWPVTLGPKPTLHNTNSPTQCDHTWRLFSETNPLNATRPLESTYAAQHLHIQAPPKCRLPSSMRYTALLVYIFLTLLLITNTSALPLPSPHLIMQLAKRQAIPDSSGNTGNEPAPVKSQPPPIQPSAFTSATVPTTPETSAAISAPVSTLTTTSAATPSTTTLPTSTSAPTPPSTLPPATTSALPPARTTTPNGNTGSSSDGSLGENASPRPPPGPPPGTGAFITTPRTGLSPGAIAGIVSGAVVALIIAIMLALFIIRRLRQPDIAEIPIRRSRIGTNLARRVLGSLSAATSRAGSRADSRASSRSSGTGEMPEKGGRLNKADIGRPKAASVENGFLAAPRPAFLQEARRGVDEEAGWRGKEGIRGPFPARPRSAEPLGRLSGMGLGMGYGR